MATTPSLRTTSNVFIVSLSIADLAVNVVIPFIAVSFFNYGWPYDPFWCRFLCYTLYIALGSSMSTLTMIAANRCCLVSCARKTYSKYCGWKGTTLCLIFNWFVSIALVVFQHLAGFVTVHYDPHLRFCYPDISKPNTYWYTTAVLIRDLFMCLFLIPHLYCKTFHTLHASNKRMHRGAIPPPGRASKERHKSVRQCPEGLHHTEIKLTKMMALICLTIVLLWMPLWIMHLLRLSLGVPLWMHRIGLMLILTNSSINPYLYAWLNSNFRQAYKRILRCGRNHRISHQDVVL